MDLREKRGAFLEAEILLFFNGVYKACKGSSACTGVLEGAAVFLTTPTGRRAAGYQHPEAMQRASCQREAVHALGGQAIRTGLYTLCCRRALSWEGCEVYRKISSHTRACP
eukprot:TRINITY_DN32653_c0_g1_i1.p1 TRINITY_DN32653_c0_g1~~TRINITY_DN32653_c0_g1_i1.p1  ORF type:complete len:111 (-),score=4.93 TRINITY_DN32653_c0_g1_i1:146-478(-)